MKTFEMEQSEIARERAVLYDELEKANRLINDREYSKSYFLEGEEIEGFCEYAAKVVNHAYLHQTSCSAAEVRTIMFDYFTADDSAKLRSYKGFSLLTTWLNSCTMHHIFHYYDGLGFYRPKALSLNTTSLTIKSLHPSIKALVVNLVTNHFLHNVLWMYYVENCTDAECCSQLNLGPEQFKTALKLADKTLHKAILASGDKFLINEALSTKLRPRNVNIDDISVADKIDETQELDKQIYLALKEVCGLDCNDPLFDSKLQDFIIDSAHKMKPDNVKLQNWERNVDIWKRRVFDKESAKSIAELYNIRSSNVDNIKFTVNNIFRTYMRNKFARYID